MRCVETFKRGIDKTLGAVAPEPTVLWERAGVNMETTTVEPGRSVDIPFFPKSRIDKRPVALSSVDIIENGRRIGEKTTYSIEMTTGISRNVIVYLPTPEVLEAARVTIHMDTPWFTGEEGHNDGIAIDFMKTTGQPVIMIGPENMEQHRSGLYIVKHLAEVATDASKVSLALAAQDSMQIAGELAELHGLARLFVQVGESRAANMAAAKHPHAANLDIQNVYYDITDPTIAENIRHDPRNLVRVPFFPISEVANIAPVGVDMLLHGNLLKEKGTFPTRAQYLGAAVLGTGPALFGGEAGEFPAYLPSDVPVHFSNFTRNPLAEHKKWRQKFGHTQSAGVNLHAAHLGLAYSSVRRHVSERINRFLFEYECVGAIPENLPMIDYRRVHLRDDQRFLDGHEHMPDVA